ncbi:MAG: hypothetical protein LBQ12_14150 [Deltaproteobacteria bacterium]|jgi:hypothetical protein|nr:hypothetical protein [Deltaproteobacteria bacterium]
MEVFEGVLKLSSRRLWAFYVRWNFCKPEFADGSPKPESRLFNAFYHAFYLKCPCCAALRGLLAGFVFGAGLSCILLRVMKW